jgi:2-polyprenyl-3-methyl-5-hydroxy-6-metoxy-1,4-benzoquinol methylase
MTQTESSPMLVFETLHAYQRTEALKAAIELKLFTAIAGGAHTAEALAERCQAASKGMRILADFLTVQGMLTKDGASYSLTPDSKLFLVEGSPAYMGGMANFMLHPQLKSASENLAAVVRKGATLLEGAGTVSADNPVWEDFARGMMPMMMPAAQKIADLTAGVGALKVLDIAAGHGLFGIVVAQRNPQAVVYALDWKAVLAVARGHAVQFGVADRWHALEGDAFKTDYGTDYDLVLMTNFLHHFDFATNVGLLKRVRAALKPGGRMAILEFAVNDDRVTPPGAATFALQMLASTQAGDAYSFNELEAMCREAGFTKVEHQPVPPTPQSITIAVKLD